MKYTFGVEPSKAYLHRGVIFRKLTCTFDDKKKKKKPYMLDFRLKEKKKKKNVECQFSQRL